MSGCMVTPRGRSEYLHQLPGLSVSRSPNKGKNSRNTEPRLDLEIIHSNIVFDIGTKEHLRNKEVQERDSILNSTGMFTFNISFPLMRILYGHRIDSPT